MEVPMQTHILQHTDEDRGMASSAIFHRACAHQRLIDDIWTRGGQRTGKVRCLECGAVIDDPYCDQR